MRNVRNVQLFVVNDRDIESIKKRHITIQRNNLKVPSGLNKWSKYNIDVKFINKKLLSFPFEIEVDE